MSTKHPQQTTLRTPGGILVSLKSKLSLVLGITPPTLKLLIDRYVQTSFARTSVGAHSERINYYKQLTKEEMTIKVFFRFLKIIDISTVKITVTATTTRGKEVTVSEEITLMGTSTEESSDA